ncbi:MAG: hypothetical protein NC923_04915 [Candidatus Omnitrophica bacterium]|nr:hypothetical protein [Candidatus Omnitrophota bacterium]
MTNEQDQLNAEIDSLERNINQRQFELMQLNRQVEIYKRTYDNLSTKIEDARIAKAAQLGEVRIVSLAFAPQYPVRPNKKKISLLPGWSVCYLAYL